MKFIEIVEEYKAGTLTTYSTDPQEALAYAEKIMKNGNPVCGVIMHPSRIVIYNEKGAVCAELLPY